MISNSNMFKINAPMFIYSILYNKPSPRISGRISDHPHKSVNGISIDEQVPTESINKLFNIKEIETKSSCQGTNLDLPTFLIFRPVNQDIEYVKQFVKNLNAHKNIKAGYDTGNGGKYRIGVTTKLFYDSDDSLKIKEFNQWWNELPKIIQDSLPK